MKIVIIQKHLTDNLALQYIQKGNINISHFADQRTKTTDIIHVKTSPSSNEMSSISEAFTTTTSSWTKSLIPVKITTISGMM